MAQAYQSPISPGRSWYEDTAGERPRYLALDGSTSCDVAIVGGGFTGLSAAVHLAKAGTDVVVIDGCRFGDGASGRNGGQLGTGQRASADELEAEIGYERSRLLHDLAEEAKAHLLDFAQTNNIEIDFRPGHINTIHRKRFEPDYRAWVETMAERYDYPHLRWMDAAETADRLGSTLYHGGVRDAGTGHIHPFKLLIGTARVAAASGARLHEETPATSITSEGGKVRIETPRGKITADKVLIATNAYVGGLEPVTASHIMPIGSFIGATPPLGDDSPVLPGWESVSDSRFVVRYFRKSPDGRLLFGGREIYSPGEPKAMHEAIRRQIAEVYPQLADVQLTHAWGGYVGITLPRKPFVREVMPNVMSVGGYSGHGVMLSNFAGRLYAEAVTGNRDRLRYFSELNVPPFPGGARFRSVLLFLALNWYALRDRL